MQLDTFEHRHGVLLRNDFAQALLQGKVDAAPQAHDALVPWAGP